MHLSIRKPRYDNAIAKGDGVCAWRYSGSVPGHQSLEDNYRGALGCNYTGRSPLGCEVHSHKLICEVSGGPLGCDRKGNRWRTRTVGMVPSYLRCRLPDMKELDHLVGNHVQYMRPLRVDKPLKFKCDCSVRFPDNCCAEVTNEQSSRNPNSCLTPVPDRLRTIASSERTNQWCNYAASAYCGFRNRQPCYALRGSCCIAPNVRCRNKLLDLPPSIRVLNSNSKRSGDMVNDYCLRETELMQEIQRLEEVTQCLRENTRKLENDFEFTDCPLAVNQTNIEQHYSTNCPDPEVLETICREREILLKARKLMDNLMKTAQIQLLKNCQINQSLVCLMATEETPDRNISNKINNLVVQTTKLAFHPGIKPLNREVRNSELWGCKVLQTVSKSYEQRKRSEEIICRIVTLFRTFHTDWSSQQLATNNAYMRHAQDNAAREMLIQQPIFQTEDEIEKLCKLQNSLFHKYEGKREKLYRLQLKIEDNVNWKGDSCSNSVLNKLTKESEWTNDRLCELERVMDETENRLQQAEEINQQHRFQLECCD